MIKLCSFQLLMAFFAHTYALYVTVTALQGLMTGQKTHLFRVLTIFQSSQLAVFKRHTMVDNSQEYRLKYWATCSSDRSFTRTANSFTYSGLLASLARGTVID